MKIWAFLFLILDLLPNEEEERDEFEEKTEIAQNYNIIKYSPIITFTNIKSSSDLCRNNYSM